ncbi:MAG: JAB domain-containing protein [Bacteroidota bacterium]
MISNLFTNNIAEIHVSYFPVIKNADRPKVTGSHHAYEIFKEAWDDSFALYEGFYIMLLNRGNKVLGLFKCSEGDISGTVVDPKKIFGVALKAQASSLILAHNHPSGNLEPSEADKKLTRKLRDAGLFLDIDVLDHLIMIDDTYRSFADQGEM